MRDAVADELSARARLDPGPARFFAASALAHAALVTALFVARAFDEAPEKKNVIHVRLAGSGTPVATSPAPTRDPRPARAASSAPQPTPPPPAETRVPMTRPAPPPEVPAATPPKKASAGETLFGRSQQQPAPSAAPTSVQPPGQTKTPPSPVTKAPPTASPSDGAGTAGPIGVPGVGQAGVLSLEGGPFPFNDYLERMIGLVGRRWQRPAIGAEPSATVYFIIERNGRIREAEIEESSGIGAFDRAALRAVLESSPLPPLPNGYGGNWLGVHLAFH